MNATTSQYDLIIWSDGTCCDRSELQYMTHMSDDYRVVSYHDEPAYEAAWNQYMPIESTCWTQSRVDAANAEQELQS